MKLFFSLLICNIIATVILIAVYDTVAVSKRLHQTQQTSERNAVNFNQSAGAGAVYNRLDDVNSQPAVFDAPTPIVEYTPSTEGLVRWEDLTLEQQKEYEEKSKPTQ